MALHDYKGKTPVLGEGCFVAPSADLIGDVTLAEGASVWYGAAVRGDLAPIRLGKNCNVQDNSVLHVDDNGPVVLGENVVVGHGAIIHAAVVEDNCLIGMGAVVLDFAHIGRGSVIGAGAVVPPRAEIPPFSQVLGVPGRVVKTLSPETEQDRIAHALAYRGLAADYLPEEK